MDEDDLLPEEQFRLFAVSARFPQNLVAGNVPLQRLQEGVYEVRHFTGCIRIVVANQLPQAEHNAMLHLFSAKDDLLRYGARHYRPRSEESSSLLYQLFQRYQQEGLTMPDALEEFTRQTIDEILKKLPAEKRLEGLSAEKRLEGLSAEERVRGLSPDELLAALSPEAREALLRRLKDNGSPSTPE
jgi:hypothetical protein